MRGVTTTSCNGDGGAHSNGGAGNVPRVNTNKKDILTEQLADGELYGYNYLSQI